MEQLTNFINEAVETPTSKKNVGDKVLEMLKRMVDLDPDNLASRIKLGELFAQQGLAAEATHELRSALGFLKTQQRFDISPTLYVVDTPGLMWPKIEHERSSFKGGGPLSGNRYGGERARILLELSRCWSDHRN